MLIFRSSARAKLLEKPTEQDLVLSSGTFCVTDVGIVARLRPPLSRFSGLLPWQYFPTAAATLKLLTADPDLSDPVISKLNFSSEEQDQLERLLGPVQIEASWKFTTAEVHEDHEGLWYEIDNEPGIEIERARVLGFESEFAHDMDRLVRWGVGLADRCPLQTVARDLERLPHLQPAELDQYVRRMVPWLS